MLLVLCAEIPVGAHEEVAENGRVILARGERTGYAHVADRVCYFREDGSGSAFVQVSGDAPVDLRHEEHAALAIAPGRYRVVLQREYRPRAASRAVTD